MPTALFPVTSMWLSWITGEIGTLPARMRTPTPPPSPPSVDAVTVTSRSVPPAITMPVSAETRTFSIRLTRPGEEVTPVVKAWDAGLGDGQVAQARIASERDDRGAGIRFGRDACGGGAGPGQRDEVRDGEGGTADVVGAGPELHRARVGLRRSRQLVEHLAQGGPVVRRRAAGAHEHRPRRSALRAGSAGRTLSARCAGRAGCARRPWSARLGQRGLQGLAQVARADRAVADVAAGHAVVADVAARDAVVSEVRGGHGVVDDVLAADLGDRDGTAGERDEESEVGDDRRVGGSHRPILAASRARRAGPLTCGRVRTG